MCCRIRDLEFSTSEKAKSRYFVVSFEFLGAESCYKLLQQINFKLPRLVSVTQFKVQLILAI
jgi:hypothetical protein